jgi:16S rRNA (cytidine1402-2'-O)-methyltransferase
MNSLTLEPIFETGKNLPNGLWMIATPIGNLDDVSLRMRTALDKTPLLFAEDTRRAKSLLHALGIDFKTKLILRLDAQEEKKGHFRELLQKHSITAFISDAGTPTVNDPGSVLVQTAHALGIPVIPIVGPSVVTAILSVSGLCEKRFTYCGYFPRTLSDKQKALHEMQVPGGVFVWLESPKRLFATFTFLCNTIPEAKICLGKELTKTFEKISVGTVAAIYKDLHHFILQGEFVFVLQLDPIPSVSDWQKASLCLQQAKVPIATTVRIVREHYAVSKNCIYDYLLGLTK